MYDPLHQSETINETGRPIDGEGGEFEKRDMKHFSKHAQEVLAPGGHVHKFLFHDEIYCAETFCVVFKKNCS